MQWLTDNGSIFAAQKTIDIAVTLNLEPCFTPVESPESNNGMAEAFVKTFKRDYVAWLLSATLILQPEELGRWMAACRCRKPGSRWSRIARTGQDWELDRGLQLSSPSFVTGISFTQSISLPNLNSPCVRSNVGNFHQQNFSPAANTSRRRLSLPRTITTPKEIVHISPEVLGRGNDFAKKITYRIDGADPEQLIKQFRNDFNPRITVTEDMIATGTTDTAPIITTGRQVCYQKAQSNVTTV
jgi:hypothetical protein